MVELRVVLECGWLSRFDWTLILFHLAFLALFIPFLKLQLQVLLLRDYIWDYLARLILLNLGIFILVNLPLENRFILASKGDYILVVCGKSYHRHVGGVANVAKVSLIWEGSREAEELHRRIVVRSDNNITLLASVDCVYVCSTRKCWPDPRHRPSIDCCISGPLFISISDCTIRLDFLVVLAS